MGRLARGIRSARLVRKPNERGDEDRATILPHGCGMPRPGRGRSRRGRASDFDGGGREHDHRAGGQGGAGFRSERSHCCLRPGRLHPRRLRRLGAAGGPHHLQRHRQGGDGRVPEQQRRGLHHAYGRLHHRSTLPARHHERRAGPAYRRRPLEPAVFRREPFSLAGRPRCGHREHEPQRQPRRRADLQERRAGRRRRRRQQLHSLRAGARPGLQCRRDDRPGGAGRL